jgi:hypothetical protein
MRRWQYHHFARGAFIGPLLREDSGGTRNTASSRNAKHNRRKEVRKALPVEVRKAIPVCAIAIPNSDGPSVCEIVSHLYQSRTDSYDVEFSRRFRHSTADPCFPSSACRKRTDCEMVLRKQLLEKGPRRPNSNALILDKLPLYLNLHFYRFCVAQLCQLFAHRP